MDATAAPSAAWVDINQLAEARPAFPKRRIRHLIDGAQPRYNARGEMQPGNGLAPAIAKVGARPDGKFGVVLIDLNAFDRWVDQQRLEPLHGVVRQRQQEHAAA
jgi:hypothetical protein